MKLKGKNNEEMIKQLREDVKDLINADSGDLATIKPLKKNISMYGKPKKDGTWGGIPYHIKALKKAKEDYGFSVSVGEKFGILPIVVDEFT